jgi:glucose-6-phosphate 1-dehydrogenase
MASTDGARREQTLLILGAGGDLTARLLLPGLGDLLRSGRGAGLQLIGSDQRDWDDTAWRERVRSSFASANAAGPLVDAVRDEARYVRADITDEADLRRLLAASRGDLTIFFALPPQVTAKACQALTAVDLPDRAQLVLEKPFGFDSASAADLNATLAPLVPEHRVHRIDHFLGKSSVLNVLGLRFANRIFEPVLNAEHVARIDIVYDEQLGLESRAGYYDRAGALIDMIQSHLLQVMAFVAMEPPPTLNAVDLRDRKAELLRATSIWDGDPVRHSRRARYTAGEVEGRRLISYADEDGVDPARSTETLAEITVAVETWRWAGVPFRLRSGKALAERRKEAVITFKPAQRVPDGLTGHGQPDRLRIGFGQDRLALDVNINGPGDPFGIDRATLEADFGPGDLVAYGEVLAGVLDGDPTLSVRGDTAVDCWRIVEPVLAAWHDDRVPLDEYRAGSSGPGAWPRH